jgi:hypothetical protein
VGTARRLRKEEADGRGPFQHGSAQVPQGGRRDLQREVEKLAREHAGQGDALRLRMVLTSPDAPALNHVVEQTIPLT